MTLEILRPCPGETDYAAVGAASPGFICARVMYDNGPNVNAIIYGPNDAIPDANPGGGQLGVLDNENQANVFLFSSIPNAAFFASPGALNYLAVWGDDGTRAVSTFYAVNAVNTECGIGSGGGGGGGGMLVAAVVAGGQNLRRQHRDRGSHQSAGLTVTPLAWNLDARSLNSATVAAYGRRWLLRLRSVNVDPTVAGYCVWDNQYPPPAPPPPQPSLIQLRSESPLPKTWQLLFGPAGAPIIEYRRAAAEWNPLTANRLRRVSADIPGEIVPIFLDVTPA